LRAPQVLSCIQSSAGARRPRDRLGTRRIGRRPKAACPGTTRGSPCDVAPGRARASCASRSGGSRTSRSGNPCPSPATPAQSCRTRRRRVPTPGASPRSRCHRGSFVRSVEQPPAVPRLQAVLLSGGQGPPALAPLVADGARAGVVLLDLKLAAGAPAPLLHAVEVDEPGDQRLVVVDAAVGVGHDAGVVVRPVRLAAGGAPVADGGDVGVVCSLRLRCWPGQSHHVASPHGYRPDTLRARGYWLVSTPSASAAAMGPSAVGGVLTMRDTVAGL